MWRRSSGVAAAGRLLALALVLSVGPAAVAGVSVAQACREVSCFSGVVAACGSCLPAQEDAFCKSPCQPSWGSLDVITCLGQAGNTYWLNNIQSLNIKCGLPPIPNAAASDGTAGGGLGAVPDSVPTAADSTGGTTAAGATTPATVQISTAPEQSLSARGGGESPTAAALATPAVGATTTTGTAGGTTAGTDAAAAAAAAGAADVGASTGVNAAGIPQSVSNTGGAGTTGTAFDTGGAISSAIATFGCAATAPKLNMAIASGCVTSVTQNNACTQPCQAQFATFAAACRNTMAQDSFYGDTWAGIFKLCSVSFDLKGPRVVDVPADLAGGSVVATAASTQVVSSGNKPLLEAAAPTVAEQAASSSVVLSAIPLLSAAAAAALLLL